MVVYSSKSEIQWHVQREIACVGKVCVGEQSKLVFENVRVEGLIWRRGNGVEVGEITGHVGPVTAVVGGHECLLAMKPVGKWTKSRVVEGFLVVYAERLLW